MSSYHHRAERLALVLSACLIGLGACRLDPRRATLPDRLTDEQFWNLITDLSEPPGAFDHSENLVSNELRFAHLARALRPGGGVYIGVGPEQNFHYIARLQPQMAFIVDIRQENRNLHLLYKALFEISANRVEFVSRLFSRERPPGIAVDATVHDLFAHFANAKPAVSSYDATARLVRERLFDAHRFPLAPSDFDWIARALEAFYSDGPDIHYGRSRPDDPPGPSYRLLMTTVDVAKQSRSYLASEDQFARVKDLQTRNLIVPIVGDFAGSSAIRRIGDYLRRHDAVARAFYGSNVEVYLNRQKTTAFCGNLATLPHDSRTWYVGSKGLQWLSVKLQSCPRLPR